MNINKQDVRIFFRYVLPSIFSFALSGIYSIVDGYFIGNRLGDAGLSAVTIVYPIVAFIQAVGTGLGMGTGHDRSCPCDCARARTDHALCPGLLVQKRPVHDEDPP